MSEELSCGYTEECGMARFLLISAASILASMGAAANILLMFVFVRRSFPGTPPILYSTFLALLDALLCIFYVLLFGVDVAMNYLRIQSLFLLYHSYIVPAFVLTKIVQLAIPYMLLLVTVERYAWITKNAPFCCIFVRARRVTIAIGFLIACFVLRVPAAMALTVEVFPQCEDFFRTLAVTYEGWAQQSEWFHWYDSILVSIGQILIPFVALVILNGVIVVKLAAAEKENKASHPASPYSQRSEDNHLSVGDSSTRPLKRLSRRPLASAAVRNAVYTTVVIVATYLMCSGLHIVLTILEKADSSLLKDEEDPTKASSFYTIVGDTISFFYMFTSGIRILIYCKCSPAIRISILRTLEYLPSMSTKLKKASNNEGPIAAI